MVGKYWTWVDTALGANLGLWYGDIRMDHLLLGSPVVVKIYMRKREMILKIGIM